MSKPLFCIIGGSASGKSTLVELIHRNLGLEQVPSYTTRLPRFDGEQGHIFISKEKFSELRNVVAYNNFCDNDYGVTSEQIDDDKYQLYVVDKTGLLALREHYKGDRKIYSVFIQANDTVRYDRMYERYNKMFRDKYFEGEDTNSCMLMTVNKVMERIEQDKIEFADCDKIVDYVIDNDENILNAYSCLEGYINEMNERGTDNAKSEQNN